MHLPRALAAALLCLLLASPVSAEPLQLYTEEYPPVSFSENGEVDGMATEGVRELLRRLGEQASIQSLNSPLWQPTSMQLSPLRSTCFMMSQACLSYFMLRVSGTPERISQGFSVRFKNSRNTLIA